MRIRPEQVRTCYLYRSAHVEVLSCHLQLLALKDVPQIGTNAGATAWTGQGREFGWIGGAAILSSTALNAVLDTHNVDQRSVEFLRGGMEASCSVVRLPQFSASFLGRCRRGWNITMEFRNHPNFWYVSMIFVTCRGLFHGAASTGLWQGWSMWPADCRLHRSLPLLLCLWQVWMHRSTLWIWLPELVRHMRQVTATVTRRNSCDNSCARYNLRSCVGAISSC